MAETYVCHTVGHSLHTVEAFADLLKRHGVDVVVDVRSSPYSRMAPHFNRGQIDYFLKDAGLKYIYLGNLLGARHEAPELLFGDGRVDFSEVAETPAFREGVERVLNGLRKGYGIALMCSEKEPFDCHRFVLVGRELTRRGVAVEHILPEGSVSQRDLEKRLLEKYGLDRGNLFMDREETLAEAYRLRNLDIAYNARTGKGDEL